MYDQVLQNISRFIQLNQEEILYFTSLLKEKIEHLNQLVLEGKALDAFELYDDDQVVMQENESPATVGKTANRNREILFSAVSPNFAAQKSWTWRQ